MLVETESRLWWMVWRCKMKLLCFHWHVVSVKTQPPEVVSSATGAVISEPRCQQGPQSDISRKDSGDVGADTLVPPPASRLSSATEVVFAWQGLWTTAPVGQIKLKMWGTSSRDKPEEECGLEGSYIKNGDGAAHLLQPGNQQKEYNIYPDPYLRGTVMEHVVHQAPPALQNRADQYMGHWPWHLLLPLTCCIASFQTNCTKTVVYLITGHRFGIDCT